MSLFICFLPRPLFLAACLWLLFSLPAYADAETSTAGRGIEAVVQDAPPAPEPAAEKPQTGKKPAARPKPSPSPQTEPPRFQVTVLTMSPQRGEMVPRLVRDDDILRSGDWYKIIVMPHKDCNVQVLQLDSSGQFYQLFPPRGAATAWTTGANPLRRNETRILPAPEQYYVLDDTRGTEWLYVLVSTPEDSAGDELERLFDRLEHARAGQGDLEACNQDLGEFVSSRGIAGVVTDSALEVAWKPGDQVHSVHSPILQTLEQMSLFRLRFIHD
jgi:hypothetical protein